MDAFFIISLILNWVFVHRKNPLQTHKSPKMCLKRRKCFSEVSAKKPCKLVSNTKRLIIKKPMPQNSNKPIMFTSYRPKTDHQGSKIHLGDFRWIGLYITEMVLPNNKFLVRNIGTNKTQKLNQMRLRQFTPRQPIPDIPITPRE